jgi:hypothetical protein
MLFKFQSRPFSVNLHKKSAKGPPSIEVSFLDLETPGSEQRQVQIEQERNAREIQEIARRSEAIRDLFLDLENLVVEQGTLVDRIDATLQTTLENAMRAHDEVEGARKHQGKSRMWICVVVLIVIILMLFVCATVQCRCDRKDQLDHSPICQIDRSHDFHIQSPHHDLRLPNHTVAHLGVNPVWTVVKKHILNGSGTIGRSRKRK